MNSIFNLEIIENFINIDSFKIKTILIWKSNINFFKDFDKLIIEDSLKLFETNNHIQKTLVLDILR